MLLQTIENTLSNLSIWSVIVPVIVGFSIYPRLDKASRILLYILIAASVPQLLRAFINHSALLNITYNVYTFIEYILTLLLFKQIEPGKNRVYNYSSVIYIFVTISLVYRFGLTSFLPTLVSLNSFFYILWILMIIINRYRHDEALYLFDTRYSLFWFISGLLFYSTCTFIIFLLWDFIKSHPKSIYTHLWLIHSIFNINMYMAFAIGMYKNKQDLGSQYV